MFIFFPCTVLSPYTHTKGIARVYDESLDYLRKFPCVWGSILEGRGKHLDVVGIELQLQGSALSIEP